MLVYKQTKEWERCPNFFRHLYETLMPENFGKHSQKVPTGKTESKDQASHSRKQQTTRSHNARWWLSHQRPVRMGLHCQARSSKVKQGATTILEDSTAYAVSTSSLTMEVEAVTHPLRWFASRGDSQTTHAILLTDSMSLVQKMKSGMGSPDWKLLQNVLWVYCPGHGRVKGNDQADRLAGKATITSSMCLGRS